MKVLRFLAKNTSNFHIPDEAPHSVLMSGYRYVEQRACLLRLYLVRHQPGAVRARVACAACRPRRSRRGDVQRAARTANARGHFAGTPSHITAFFAVRSFPTHPTDAAQEGALAGSADSAPLLKYLCYKNLATLASQAQDWTACVRFFSKVRRGACRRMLAWLMSAMLPA